MREFEAYSKRSWSRWTLDLMLELNERMEDVHLDLKRTPIEFYAKYKRLLHKHYDVSPRSN